jgi:hypothetical protein
MKHLVTRAAPLLAPLAALAALIFPPALVQAQTLTLNDADTVEAEFRVGETGKIAVMLKFADGKVQTLLGAVQADTLKRTVEKDGKKTPELVPMADGWIEFTGAGLQFQYHSRPHLRRYTEAQQADLAKVWETLPAASRCWLPLELRADAAGVELWLDGRYCGRVASTRRLAEVSFKLEADGAVRRERVFTRADSGMFLPLDVRRSARPGVMKECSVSLKSGAQQVNKVPMVVADGAGNADVGVVKEMQGLRGLETNENTSRTSLDGMKESLHFSVPQAFYHRAWVLCAVDPDVAKDAVLTTRLTRFGGWGRGGAMADTTLTLPRGDEKPGAGIEQVGSVEYTADQKKIKTPLYLVRVDLKAGDILDILADQHDPYAPMKIGPYGPGQKICNADLPKRPAPPTTWGCQLPSIPPTNFGYEPSKRFTMVWPSLRWLKPIRSTAPHSTAGWFAPGRSATPTDWSGKPAVAALANSRNCPPSSGERSSCNRPRRSASRPIFGPPNESIRSSPGNGRSRSLLARWFAVFRRRG